MKASNLLIDLKLKIQLKWIENKNNNGWDFLLMALLYMFRMWMGMRKLKTFFLFGWTQYVCLNEKENVMIVPDDNDDADDS